MYKLVKGDSVLKLKEIDTSIVDAIITDPPYLYLNHKLDNEFNEDEVFREWYRILKEDGMLVLFGRGIYLARWMVKLDELGFKFLEEVVWSGSSGGSSFKPIQQNHEMMVIFTKGSGKINKIRIDPTSIPLEQIKWNNLFSNINRLKNSLKDPYTLKIIKHYIESGELTYDTYNKLAEGASITGHSSTYAGTNRGLGNFITTTEGYLASTVLEVGHTINKNHPTEKPVRLMEILVRLVTQEDGVVLDPFMGSGSTGVAALNLGRQFIGIEIDDEYFNTAKQRLDEVSNNIDE